ncbi:CGNR zinc finger domain-containing protein [Gordonia polyisoprenivorans]|uniref:CGNR zinc finger domain-containing protein n=1 Tax=Gordonia polyisoprenivorans TaxID=84595 RepID=UPI000378C4A2|nr:CGNR zinc finger domain-containing protein [Gordonia polyisoprenivorans]WCB38232.1 CGNR zinc finger domain-containing protein [Gordonia polyisoprenivorans]
MTSQADPRPLLGEPLPLDLLDTHWIEGGRLQDLLETVGGVEIWLRSAIIDERYRPERADAALRAALCTTREAIASVARRPAEEESRSALNDVLAHGHRELSLGADGVHDELVVDDPAWTVPWLAAEGYLDLLARVPDRIRQCEHPQCVLWYLDTSRSGTRRWCSMAICGNRTKARRHQQGRAGDRPA